MKIYQNKKVMKRILLSALLGVTFVVGTDAGTGYAAQAAMPSKAPAETIAASSLSNQWDKTFPVNDKVAHKKVTFHNRYGITLVGDLTRWMSFPLTRSRPSTTSI